ncbi:MAG: PAS domain S-box protein [Candidatus Hodarchaeota archaeon]
MNNKNRKSDFNVGNYKAIFKTIPIPTYVWKVDNDDFKLIDCNKAAEIITEGKISDYLSLSLIDIYDEDFEVSKDLKKCFEEKVNFSKEMFYKFKSTGKQKVLYTTYNYIPPNLVIVYTEDISKQKEAENLLKKAEGEKSIILESISEHIIYQDLDNRIIWTNKAAADSVGLTTDQLIGKKCHKIWNKRDDKCPGCPVISAVETCMPTMAEMTTSDGRVWLIKGFPVLDEKGKVLAAVEITNEITQIKKAEEKLKDSELQYRNTIDSMGDAIHVTDKDLRLILINPAIERWLEVLGLETDVLGKKLNDAFPFLSEKVLDEYKQVLDSGETLITDEETFIKGKTYFTESRKIPIISKGKVIQIVTIVRDFGERKISEQKLKASEKKFRHLFETSPYGIVLLDLKGNIIDCNTSTNRFLSKHTIDNLIGRNFKEIRFIQEKNKNLIPFFENIIERVINGEKIKDLEFPINRSIGGIIWVNSSVSLTKVGDESLIQFILEDISDKKDAATELKESEKRYREAYNRSNFYKDLFAHDINNIFQNIQSSTELLSLLLDEMNITKGNNFIDIIKDQIIRGSNLISNVRKLSEIEEIESPLKNIELFGVLNEVKNYIIKSFQNKNINLEILSDEEQIFINANELLPDVFENILINAIRYNQNPLIELIIKVSKDIVNGKNFIRMEFIDNGIGIPNEMKEKVFQRGYNHKGIIKGLGLGLTLVKKVIGIYNGQIWAEDKVNGDYTQGTKFIILIPEVE